MKTSDFVLAICGYTGAYAEGDFAGPVTDEGGGFSDFNSPAGQTGPTGPNFLQDGSLNSRKRAYVQEPETRAHFMADEQVRARTARCLRGQPQTYTSRCRI